jgi:hypothetical protein
MRPPRRPSVRRFRPTVESLETREVPAVPVWTALGPGPIQGGAFPASGRITVAVPDPSDSTGNTMYVAGDSGGQAALRQAGAPPSQASDAAWGFGTGSGIWKTTNWLSSSQPTWTPLTDTLPSLDIAEHGLAISPSNPSVLYAAANGPDGGILMTSNSGQSWTCLTGCSSANGSQFADATFGAVVVHPTKPDLAFVAVLGSGIPGSDVVGGVYQVSVSGSTATVTNITPSSFGPVFASDLLFDPSDPSTLYATIVNAQNPAVNGFYQVQFPSGGGMPTWTPATSGFAAGSDIGGYIQIALAPSNPSVLYATVFGPTNSNENPSQQRYRSGDGGTTWTQLNLPPPVMENGSSIPNIDWRTWHTVLAVEPDAPNTFWANGDEPLLLRGTYDPSTGQVAWAEILTSREDVVQVTFDFTPGGRALVLAGDRGVHRSTNFNAPPAQVVFQPRQGNLQNALVYQLAVVPTSPTTVYAVAQDQLSDFVGTGLPAWNRVAAGGEVGVVLVNPDNPDVVYSYSPNVLDTSTQMQIGPVVRSTHGSQGPWEFASAGINPADYPLEKQFSHPFYNGFALDPGQPDHLVAGTFRVYQTTTGGVAPSGQDAWTQISQNPLSPPASSSDPTPFITALAVAPSQGSTIYAATSDGHFWLSPPNPGPNSAWTERDTGLPVSGTNQVIDIAVDPANPAHVYVVTTGVGGTTPRVFETTNGGTSWTNLTGNLPGAYAALTIAPDWRFATPVLYVGTPRGVYQSTDGGQTWSDFGQGLPNTAVQDLSLLSSGVLTAGTNGRSVWQTTAPAPVTVTLTGSPNPAALNAPVTFTATVTPVTAGGPAPTGWVYFQDVTSGTVVLDKGDLNAAGQATFTTSTLSAGSHDIVAAYQGDANYAGNTSPVWVQTITAQPAARGATPNERFVDQVYLDLLHRPADPVGLALFAGILDRGWTRAQVVSAVENSPEFRGGEVDRLYRDLLDQAADPAGRSTALGALDQGGTLAQVREVLLGSPAYLAVHGGTNAGFLSGLYHDVLGRPPDPSGLASWGQVLAGGVSRPAVVGAFVRSEEAAVHTVASLYRRLLGREADAAGLAGFAAALERGAAEEDIRAAIAGSAEYFGRVNHAFHGAYLTRLYRDVLGRPADPGGLAFWTGLLDQGAWTPDQVAQAFVGSQEYQTLVVQRLYARYLGRPADPGGLASALAFLGGGRTAEELAATLAGSPEFFLRSGGTTTGFLDALFQAALGRPIDPPTRTAFDQALAAGATREQVAGVLFQTPEYRQGLVRGYYDQFLHRPADPAGLAAWVRLLEAGWRDEQVIAVLVHLREYLGLGGS